MKKNQEFKTTTNRTVYNRRRKEVLADCSFCRWHPTFWKFSENDQWKDYYVDGKKPNWKLVSKNKKQWMKKPLKIYTYNEQQIEKYRYKLIW